MSDRRSHAQVLHLRICEYLVDHVNGAARNVRRLENLHPFGRGLCFCDCCNRAIDFLACRAPSGLLAPLGAPFPFGFAERIAQPKPVYGGGRQNVEVPVTARVNAGRNALPMLIAERRRIPE